MAFFNKKEEVIDIQLTQFGKHLLSQGAFKPEFYAFFDNDILYDGNYGDITEKQNETRGRIISETPKNKTQYVFHSIEKNLHQQIQTQFDKKNNASFQLQAEQMDIFQSNEERNYALPLPLGTTSFNKEYAPAWSVKMRQGELAPVVADSPNFALSHASSSMNPFIEIPQLYSTIKFKSVVKNINDEDDLHPEYDEGFNLKEQPFDDGDFFALLPEQLMIEIEEKNTSHLHKNFDIEVFEMTTISLTDAATGDDIEEEKLIPLTFVAPKEYVKNDILLTKEQQLLSEAELELLFPALKANYVGHYFDIYVDHEISLEDMCAVQPPQTKKGKFVESALDCKSEDGDGFGQDQNGLYGSAGDIYDIDSDDSTDGDC